MEKERINFLNIPVDALTMAQTIDKIDTAIQNHRKISHVVINAGKVVAMQTDEELFKSVTECDIINADGQSVVWAARFLGKKLPERVAGIDLMQNLMELAFAHNYKVFFFGAKEEIVSKIVKIYSEKYSPEIIAGYRNGYFLTEEEKGIAEQIAQSGAQMLFVAISSPKKENFLYSNREILQTVYFTMGVGGSFDVVAGFTKRAPLWMQKIGMEWFYRFLQEPTRMWKRYLLGNSRFIWLVVKEKLRKS